MASPRSQRSQFYDEATRIRLLEDDVDEVHVDLSAVRQILDESKKVQDRILWAILALLTTVVGSLITFITTTAGAAPG